MAAMTKQAKRRKQQARDGHGRFVKEPRTFEELFAGPLPPEGVVTNWVKHEPDYLSMYFRQRQRFARHFLVWLVGTVLGLGAMFWMGYHWPR